METVILSVLNPKGGVAKSTSAIHLAVAFAEQGKSVEVWDSDPQGSAFGWAQTAEELGEKLPFEVHSVNKRELKSKQPNSEIVLIDTPPAYADVIDLAAKRADLVIMPSAPSEADLEQVITGLEALPDGKPAAVLLTNVNERTRLYRDTREFLDKSDIAVFETAIKSLQVVKTNFNHYPRELAGYDQVALEICNLFEMEETR